MIITKKDPHQILGALALDLKPYLQKLLSKMDEMLEQEDHKKLAEDALMYSVLFQNAAVKGKI